MIPPATPPLVLFPSDVTQPRSVDPSFAGELRAARSTELRTALVDQERLDQGSSRLAVGAFEPAAPGIYRGWMLGIDQYESLFVALSERGVQLINTPAQYRHCHWLPESFELIREHSPASVWIPASGDGVSLDAVVEAAASLGDGPVIVRDYVKSRKHEWTEACFIPGAGDVDHLRRVVSTFIDRQGDSLAGGVVLREYIDLERVGTHPKSGMPLTNEHRIFVLDGEPLLVARYWSDAEYSAHVPIDELRAVMLSIRSRFFTLDVARGADGKWWIIELGDAQVAGLLETITPEQFFGTLSRRLR